MPLNSSLTTQAVCSAPPTVTIHWEEAQLRLKEMIKVLAYVPFRQIVIEFLNCRDQLILTQQGRTPAFVIKDAYDIIDRVFARLLDKTTPTMEKLQESLIIGQGKSIVRYFLWDGTSDGGVMAQDKIINILTYREDSERNPMTFISCTNENDQTE